MTKSFEMLCCIVNSGLGSKTLTNAKACGIRGGTICIGRGVIKNKFLEFLDIVDIRKEIVIMIAERTLAFEALKKVSKIMAFHKPNHGIAFSISLDNFIADKDHEYVDKSNIKAEEAGMFSAIFTIVEKGIAEEVMDSANKAGARGGTIINARGSGIHEVSKLFSMPIEPEKEIVLIITKNDLTEQICNSIRKDIRIDDPGRGIIFVVGLSEAVGLY